MTLIVNPTPGMVPVYPFYKAQDYYYRKIIEVRDAQNLIAPNFTFDVTKNKSETSIVSEIKRGIVNVMVGSISNINQTKHGKEHVTKLIFELYWKSKDDDTNKIHADELASEHLYYLAANVEYALSAIYNQVPDNIPYGEFKAGEITPSFSRAEKIGKSESVFGLGHIEFEIQTQYSFAENALPNLVELEADLGNGIKPIFEPNPEPVP